MKEQYINLRLTLTDAKQLAYQLHCDADQQPESAESYRQWLMSLGRELDRTTSIDAAHTRARSAGRCHCSNCRPDLHDGKDN